MYVNMLIYICLCVLKTQQEHKNMVIETESLDPCTVSHFLTRQGSHINQFNARLVSNPIHTPKLHGHTLHPPAHTLPVMSSQMANKSIISVTMVFGTVFLNLVTYVPFKTPV